MKALLFLLVASSALAQGSFQNLDFEAANLIPIPGDPYGSVQFAPAFPGWTGSVGTNLQSRALYNNIFLDTSGISIIDKTVPSFFGYPIVGLIEGEFTAVLQAGWYSNFTPTDTTLSQTGLVPSTAQSLQFKASFAGSYSLQAVLNVKLGGQSLAFNAIRSGTNYTVFGADIHTWAGQTAELDFTVLAEVPHQNNRYVFLDSIEFSSVAIPAPSVLTLSALGTLLLTWRFLRQASTST